jgi:hypothetical protein
MTDNREERVRVLAHALWEHDGSPEGQDADYWLRAEKMIDAELDPAAPGMTKTPPL